ncbi:MAG: aspartyl/asparaginyl beta-hydroxylase domain-containing protein [Thermoanaerobaculia bacterium]
MTRPIGELALDQNLLNQDIAQVETFKMAPIYSEYSRGNPGWRSAVLFNQNGSTEDAYIKSYVGPGRFTPLADRVPYIKGIIEHFFDSNLLLWARFMCVKNGFIMPHRDYLDVDGGLIRIHVPLATDSSCISTEEDRAFHMAVGQVCFLDGSKAHAAASLADFHRIHLCLDFKPTASLVNIFHQKEIYYDGGEFSAAQRAALEDGFEAEILDLSRFLDESSFFEVSGIMGLIHFRREVNCRKTYDWLCEAARKTGNQALLFRAKKLQADFLGAIA